jgi:hypothetical protein
MKMLRVWCAAHQLDIVIQKATKAIEDGQFFQDTHAYTVQLRGQKKLVAAIGKCPKNTNRWAHFQSQLGWVLSKRTQLEKWNSEVKDLSCTPEPYWWIVCAAINPLAIECNTTLVILQARDTCLSQQLVYIDHLVLRLSLMVEAQLIDTEGSEAILNDAHYKKGAWCVAMSNIRSHVEDQGSWVSSILESLDEDEQDKVLHSVAKYAISLINGFSGVKAERDSNNLASMEETPPIFPHELVKLRPSVFIKKVLDPRRDMLKMWWSQDEIDMVEREHRDLHHKYRTVPEFAGIIDAHDHKTMFNKAWKDVETVDEYSELRMFCGGLGCAFANTTSVESDFSHLKAGKSLYRQSLMALSVEGLFQARQYQKMSLLANRNT